MYIGSRVLSAASNKRTGSRTNSAVSGATANSILKKSSFQSKFREMPRYEPITVEPRPQTKAYDWMTHGNSIGNGSLIYIGEVDSNDLDASRAK